MEILFIVKHAKASESFFFFEVGLAAVLERLQNWVIFNKHTVKTVEFCFRWSNGLSGLKRFKTEDLMLW